MSLTGAAGVAQRLWAGEAGGCVLAFAAAGGTGGGHAAQGYLGVDLREVADSSWAPGHAPRGAEILRVDHDGPAAKAGLQEHDIVLNVNGQAVEGAEPLRRTLHEMQPGRQITITVIRGGQQRTVSLQMADREEVEREAWRGALPDPPPLEPVADPPAVVRRGNSFLAAPGRASRSLLGGFSPAYTGAMLEAMAPQLAEYFGAQGKTGLLVRSVDANSPAALAGLRAGDVVVRVNQVGVSSNGDWMRVVRDNKGRAIPVVVLREKREQTLMMTPNTKHHSMLLPEIWPRRGNAFWGGAPPDRASVSPVEMPH